MSGKHHGKDDFPETSLERSGIVHKARNDGETGHMKA